jgi:hypothetical protein
MITPSPTAAAGVSAGVIPVPQGATTASAPASSATATNRMTGAGRNSTPVCPSAMIRCLLWVPFTSPENANTPARDH